MEKILQPNPHRFVIFPIEHDDIYIRCKTKLKDSTIESNWSKTEHVYESEVAIFSMFAVYLLFILI